MGKKEFTLPPLYTLVDLILLFIIGAFSVGFYTYRLGLDNSNSRVLVAVVRSGDRVVARLELSRDTTITVDGAIGGLTVAVDRGILSFKNSRCPLKICEKSGGISRDGSVLVCAPNRVMARIEGIGTESGGGIDALSR
jgi:hypothetical protein